MKKSNPESVYERIVEITNTYDDDYIIYKKIKNLKYKYDEKIGKEKALQIIHQWFLENSEYCEENDKYNGHEWRIKYMERYDNLLERIYVSENKKEIKKNSSKKTTSKKTTPKKTSPKKNSPKKTSPKK